MVRMTHQPAFGPMQRVNAKKPQRHAALGMCVLLAAFAIFAASLVILCPRAFAVTSSYAENYHLMNEVAKSTSFVAEVDSQGVLHVTERRVVSPLSPGNYYEWPFPPDCQLTNRNLMFDQDEPITIEDANGKHVLSLPTTVGPWNPTDNYKCTIIRSDRAYDYILISGDSQLKNTNPDDEVVITLKYSAVSLVYFPTVRIGKPIASLRWSCLAYDKNNDADDVSVEISLPAADDHGSAQDLTIRKNGAETDEFTVSFDATTHTYTMSANFPLVAKGTLFMLGVDFPAAGIESLKRAFADGNVDYSLAGTLGIKSRYAYGTGQQQTQTTARQPEGPSIAEILMALIWWLFGVAFIMIFGLSYRFLPKQLKADLWEHDAVEPQYRLPSYDHPSFLSYFYRTSKGLSWVGEGLAGGLADLVRRKWVKLGEDGKTFELAGIKRVESPIDDFDSDDLAVKTYQFFETLAEENGTFTLVGIMSSSTDNPSLFIDFVKAWISNVEDFPTVKNSYEVHDHTKAATIRFGVCCAAFALQWLGAIVFCPNVPFVCVGILVTAAIGITVLWRAKKGAMTVNQAGRELLDRCEAFQLWLQTSEARLVIAELEPEVRNRYIAAAAAFDVSLADSSGDQDMECDLGDDPLVKALFGSSTCAAILGSSYEMAFEDKRHEQAEQFGVGEF